MNWTRTAAGTAVIAGLVLTGTTLWQGASRRQIAPVDWFEIVEAYQERAAAAYTTAHIRTNSIPYYTPEARTYVDHYEGTNAITTNYLAWVSNNIVITTNWWVDRNKSAEYLDGLGNTVIGRVASTVATNLTVEDLWEGGTYSLIRLANPVSVTLSGIGTWIPGWSVVFVSNEWVPIWGETGTWADRNPEIGLTTDGTRWYWVHYPFSDYWGYGYFAASDEGKPLASGFTGLNWNGTAWVRSINPPITITEIGTGTVVECNAKEYAIANFAIGRQISLGAAQDVVTNTLALIPKFIDHTKNSNDNYRSFFENPSNPTNVPALTVTGVFARLQVGNLTNLLTTVSGRSEVAKTNWVYSYTNWWPSNGAPHILCYTGSEWQAASIATNWTTNGYDWAWYSNASPLVVAATDIKATYSTTLSAQVYTNTLIELAKILSYLKDTATTNFAWTNTLQSAEYTNVYIADRPFTETAAGLYIDSDYFSWDEAYTFVTDSSVPPFLPWEIPDGALWETDYPVFDDVFVGSPVVTTNNSAPLRYYSWWWDFRHTESIRADGAGPHWWQMYINTAGSMPFEGWYDDRRTALTNRTSTLHINLPKPLITNVTGNALAYMKTAWLYQNWDTNHGTDGGDDPVSLWSTNWIAPIGGVVLIQNITTTQDITAPIALDTTMEVEETTWVGDPVKIARQNSRKSLYPDRYGFSSKTMSVRQCILSWQFQHLTNSIP